MQKVYIILRVCIFLLLGAGSAAASVSGTVTDADSKAPLGSMVVAVYTAAGTLQATGTTDSQGRYIVSVPTGSYRILAYDPAGTYATTFGNDADSFETSPIVNVTSDISSMDFGLRRAGTVTGMVNALQTGTRLVAITVAAYNLSSGTRRGFTQTGGNGAYSLVLPPGQYKIAAYDDIGSYSVAFFQNQSTFASASAISVTAGKSTIGVDFQLSLAAHLFGKVFDADTNAILPGMSVIAYTTDGTSMVATAMSDTSGNFSVGVPAGSYKLVAADPAHVFADGYLADANSFANEQPLTVTAGQVAINLSLPMHRAGTIAGNVADSGTPLAAITVAAYNSDGSQRAATQTDSSGAYALLVPSGEFRIAAFDTSLIYATEFYPNRNVFPNADPVSVVSSQTTRPIDFSLARGTRFTGAITDATTGTPVAGISVAAYDDSGNIVTKAVSDNSGNYALVVPAGNYRLAAFDDLLRYVTAYSGGAANYETAKVYQVGGDSVQPLDFALGHGVRFTGTVIDSSSAFTPISDVQIAALDMSGNRVATSVSKDGSFDFVLTPGIYKLLAVDPLNRFYATFYNTASTLATATPVIVHANGVGTPITLMLVRQMRRHSVLH